MRESPAEEENRGEKVMEPKESQYMEIDLLRLAKALLHRAWAVVMVTIAAAVLAFAYAALVITPLYKSSALLYVNNSSISLAGASFSISSQELSAAKSLVDTYTVILKTRTTLEAVIQKANLEMDYDTLYEMVSTYAVNNTEIFKIEVTSSDPKEAEVIANTIASVLPEKISNIVDGSSVKIVDYAVVPSRKSSPNVTKYTLAGAAAGFILICGVISVMEISDNLIKNEDYLLQTYSLPVLAAIPDLEDSTSTGGYYSYGKGKSRKSGKSDETGGQS